MSASMTNTDFPAWQNDSARFIAVLLLPSDEDGEVIMIVDARSPPCTNASEVRMPRQRSAMSDCGNLCA